MLKNKLIITSITIIMFFALAIFSSATDPAPQTFEDGVDRITPKDLKAMLDMGHPVIVADVRSFDAYKKHHIAGAISVPPNQIESSADKLPLGIKIVFY